MLNPGGDIEDLYRDFAKNYPLKTEDSGWDEFLQKMESAPVTSTPAPKPPGGTRFLHIIRKFGYWAVPAVVVAITGSVLVVKKMADQKASAPVEAARAYPGAPAQPSKAEKQPPSQQAAAQPATDATKKPVLENNIKKPAEPLGQTEKQAIVASSKTAGSLNAQNAGVKAIPGAVDNSKLPVGNTANSPAAAITEQKPAHAGDAGKTINNKQQVPGIVTADTKAGSEVQGNIAQQGEKDESGDTKDLAKKQAGAATLSSAPTLQPVDTTAGKAPKDAVKDSTGTAWSFNTHIPAVKEPGTQMTDTAAHQQDTGVKDTTAQPVTDVNTLQPGQPETIAKGNNGFLAKPAEKDRNTDSVSFVQPLVKINTRDQKYFYAGLVAGPDFSSVKFQEVEKTGSSFGVMFGVYLGHHLSIESGLLIASKKYYSGAQYFKTGILTGPDRDDLVSVNGAARFTEIPITARYDVIHKKRLKMFFTGGFSSYFTHEEKYDFLFRRLFGYETRHAESDEPYSNILSVLHLSTGIELKLNANNTFRFEPYIKIPMSGIGAGALPVTSGGFYINFTHSFFR